MEPVIFICSRFQKVIQVHTTHTLPRSFWHFWCKDVKKHKKLCDHKDVKISKQELESCVYVWFPLCSFYCSPYFRKFYLENHCKPIFGVCVCVQLCFLTFCFRRHVLSVKAILDNTKKHFPLRAKRKSGKSHRCFQRLIAI